MGKAMKRAVGAGIVAGVAYAAWRIWQARVPAPAGDVTWETAPFPFPPVPRPAPSPGASDAGGSTTDRCIEPLDGGTCPASHPVKGKVSSGIYHVPGGASYDRTHADRCYVDTAAAEADGLRPAKR